MVPRILLVEDDPKIGRALEEGLTAQGYAVTVTASGEEAFFLASSERFELLLLDWMLPGRSGLEVLKTLRQRAVQVPALMLTARDTLEDRVAGLDGGADDYLVKPFAFPELLARVRAILRRNRAEAITKLAVDDLEMDLLQRRVQRGGEALELTSREFSLLEYLLRHHPYVVSREMLARDVWSEPTRATTLDNVIDVHVARLRKKVDAEGRPRLLHTVRGVGFVVRVEPS